MSGRLTALNSQQTEADEFPGDLVNVAFAAFLPNSHRNDHNNHQLPPDLVQDPVTLADGPHTSQALELPTQWLTLLLRILAQAFDSLFDFLPNAAVPDLPEHHF